MDTDQKQMQTVVMLMLRWIKKKGYFYPRGHFCRCQGVSGKIAK